MDGVWVSAESLSLRIMLMITVLLGFQKLC
jgi:hypothetical protein